MREGTGLNGPERDGSEGAVGGWVDVGSASQTYFSVIRKWLKERKKERDRGAGLPLEEKKEVHPSRPPQPDRHLNRRHLSTAATTTATTTVTSTITFHLEVQHWKSCGPLSLG